MMKRTIIIGDIHGCITEFQQLLDKIKYDPSSDRVILVGDLIDRGPNSSAVVKLANSFNLEAVMGNHEYKFLRWYKSNQNLYHPDKQHTQYQLYVEQLSDSDITYLNNLPYYLNLDDNSAVIHAGLKPNISLEKQRKDDLIYLRYTDKERKMISLRVIDKLGIEATGALFWTEFGSFNLNIVYGHNVFPSVRIDQFEDQTACYGIDTGCCFGGPLTALIWETKEIVQVPAVEVYVEPGWKHEG